MFIAHNVLTSTQSFPSFFLDTLYKNVCLDQQFYLFFFFCQGVPPKQENETGTEDSEVVTLRRRRRAVVETDTRPPVLVSFITYSTYAIVIISKASDSYTVQIKKNRFVKNFTIDNNNNKNNNAGNDQFFYPMKMIYEKQYLQHGSFISRKVFVQSFFGVDFFFYLPCMKEGNVQHTIL